MSTLAAAGMTAGSIEGAGSYILGAKALTVGSNNLSTEVSGVISGLGGSLIKVGTGTLTLLGANTYSGGTTISGGAIEVGNNNAVGTGTVTLDGGTFRAGFNTLVVTNPFSINASGGNVDTNGNLELALTGSISGPGALTKIGAGTLVLDGNNTYSGGNVDTNGNLELALTGSMSGPGALTKIGAGTLVLDGNNTYSGGTFLQQGTLALAHDNALGTGPLTTLGSGGVAYASGVTINNPIILNSNDTELNVRLGIATQAGNISELNGPQSLEKTGSGTLVLTGATFTPAQRASIKARCKRGRPTRSRRRVPSTSRPVQRLPSTTSTRPWARSPVPAV